MDDKRFGFEEVTYLLLFGELPNEDELNELRKCWDIPEGFQQIL